MTPKPVTRSATLLVCDYCLESEITDISRSNMPWSVALRAMYEHPDNPLVKVCQICWAKGDYLEADTPLIVETNP